MTRRIGYICASRPGDFDEAFWRPRSHYAYVEMTIPQSDARIKALKDWYDPPSAEAPQERVVAGYTDFFYCGTNQQSNISDWRRAVLPPPEHPCFVRDVNGAIIPRFGGRGLFVPTVTGTSARRMAAAVVTLSLDLGIDVRLDDHSRDLGWDFTGYFPRNVRVPNNVIKWNGKTFTKDNALRDFVSADGERFSEIYARAADNYIDLLTGYGPGLLVIVNSGTKWIAGAAAKLSGRMQERNITPATFVGEPWNVAPLEEKFPMALTYPDTYDAVMALEPKLPKNVVLVETQDVKGRIIAQPVPV